MRTVALLLAVVCVLPAAAAPSPEFVSWLSGLRQDAEMAGISDATLDAALNGLEPDERVLELDRSQPEFVNTFGEYLAERVASRTVAQGHRILAEYRNILVRIQRRFGIPPRVLVALWGMETNYGRGTGRLGVVRSLATLAFDGRRGEFFRGELLDALRILDGGHIGPEDMKGSWAGAMGQMQFMPSTFVRYALDGNGDGRKDLWKTPADALYSAANYLCAAGWKRGRMWGREVRLPEDFDAKANSGARRSVSAWGAMGIEKVDGQRLPKSGLGGAIVLPQGRDGPAFLVYDNFDVLMRWNRSVNFALAVGILSDRLAGTHRRAPH